MPDYRNRPPVDRPPPSMWEEVRAAGWFLLFGTAVAIVGMGAFAAGLALAVAAVLS